MGGTLTIENKSSVHVQVTLKNSGLRHCWDTILSGKYHKYDLGRLFYDVIIEGADGDTTQTALGHGDPPRVAHGVRDEVTGTMYSIVKPAIMENVYPTNNKVLYIINTVNISGECELWISRFPPSNAPAYSQVDPGVIVNQDTTVNIYK